MSVVGFVITDLKGYKREAADFIRTVCILEDPNVADNIVNAGEGLNIYSLSVTQALLDAQPFDAEVIEREENEYLIVSATNFPVELEFQGELIRLQPTEFIRVSPLFIEEFDFYLNLGLVEQIPHEREITVKWILDNNVWDDSGLWIDSKTWND